MIQAVNDAFFCIAVRHVVVGLVVGANVQRIWHILRKQAGAVAAFPYFKHFPRHRIIYTLKAMTNGCAATTGALIVMNFCKHDCKAAKKVNFEMRKRVKMLQPLFKQTV